MARAWAIVLAAGAGTRFGAEIDGATKVSAPIGGRSMISWSVEAAQAGCDGVTLVVPAVMVDQPFDGVDAVVAGGDSRSASVRAGLETIPDGVDVVVCHDAARPGASSGLFASVISAVRAGADAAVPALGVSDTLKRVTAWSDAGGVVSGTVDRAGLYAVQTPQAFRRAVLAAAHADRAEATDDAALVEAAGGTVMAIPGEAAAHKVTTAADLVIVEALLRARVANDGL
ncbi:IspD/TarI family cytidylyltransferase [Candidatus Poriferisodalis sp.]|uniref:IspD/TarI family cytidylyltransferase n=1 Tax=Candidatus Poriferisodalis sp. TaxID=3101277 RepID=UPI003D14B893